MSREDETFTLDADPGTNVIGFRTEDWTAGYDAFYRQESPRVISHQIPADPLGYERYQKDRQFNEGWLEAKAEYDQRTKRKE